MILRLKKKNLGMTLLEVGLSIFILTLAVAGAVYSIHGGSRCLQNSKLERQASTLIEEQTLLLLSNDFDHQSFEKVEEEIDLFNVTIAQHEHDLTYKYQITINSTQPSLPFRIQTAKVTVLK